MKSSKKPFWQRVIDPQVISIVKFIHSLDHGLIPCVLARNILEALRPFINIVCSALILDRLILKTPAEQMMQIVFWMVGLNFVCSMLVALLDWVEKGPKELFLLDAEAFAKKALQLDYQEMEQTRVQDLVRMFEEVNNMGGLNLLLGPLGNSVKGLVSVVYARRHGRSAVCHTAHPRQRGAGMAVFLSAGVGADAGAAGFFYLCFSEKCQAEGTADQGRL